MSSGIMSQAMQTCSVTNPFCPEAIGSRWPDNSHTKSAPFTINGQPRSMTTDASGYGAVMYFPDLNWQSLAPASIGVGGVVTWAAVNTPLEVITAVDRYRLTSFGVKIQCTSAPMTTTGMVRVRLFSPMGPTSLTTSSIVSTMADSAYDVSLASLIDKPLYVIPMPLGDDARLFRRASYDGTLANWNNVGWQLIQIAVDGGPVSTNCLNVTLHYHYEVIFNDGDSQHTFSSAPPKDSPIVRQANSGVLETVGNFFDGAAGKLDSLMNNRAVKYIASGLTGYLTNDPAAARGAFMLMDRGPRNVD
jgi:hypothetical protein